MSGAWSVVVVRADGAKLVVLVSTEGYTDALDLAKEVLTRFGAWTPDCKLVAAERIY